MLVLAALFLFQIGAVIQALGHLEGWTPELSLPIKTQLGLHIMWAVVFGSVIMKLWNGKLRWIYRSLWIVAGFIVYSGLRLAIFSKAEYDRQRLPFVIFLVVVLLLIVFAAQLMWLKLRGSNIGEIE